MEKPVKKINCYCVCHIPVSSKPSCEHCKGDNEVGRYWKNKKKAQVQGVRITRMIKIKTKNKLIAKIVWIVRKLPLLDVITTQYPKGTFHFGIYIK